jgi:hypothetical protein
MSAAAKPRRGGAPFEAINAKTEGPHHISGSHRGIVTANLPVRGFQLAGASTKLLDLHEHTLLFNVRLMDNGGYHNHHTLLNLAQLNAFLESMHKQAMDIIKTRNLRGAEISATNIPRLVHANQELEVLNFLVPRQVASMIFFVGVQFGNRYVTVESGPGITVAMGGAVLTRNMCLNERVGEKDAVWLVLKPVEPNGPLVMQMRSYMRGFPMAPERQYIDHAGHRAYAVAQKIGVVADKDQPDSQDMRTKRYAHGLDGTSDECVIAERRAPTFRMRLCSMGAESWIV